MTISKDFDPGDDAVPWGFGLPPAENELDIFWIM